MAVHWSLPYLASLLPAELLSRIQSTQVDQFYSPPDADSVLFFNAETGDLLKAIPIGKFHRVSRRKFRALCAEGIEVQYGKAITGISYVNGGVLAEFEDGETATGTTVIGTDGARSAVRTLFLGDEGQAASAPYMACTVTVKYPKKEKALAARSLHPLQAMAVHPIGYWTWISSISHPRGRRAPANRSSP